MGVSTDGEICFGYMFDDGYEFPWDNLGLQSWWREETGFKHSFDLYTDRGEYINGIVPSGKEIDAYYAEERKWDEAHPLPVAEVNYCSGDCPMYILSVPTSMVCCSRGDPTEFNPQDLKVTDSEKQALKDFCDKYGLQPEEDMRWYLSSYWG